MGRGQMEVLDAPVALRRAVHDFYVELFQDISGVNVFLAPNDDYFANYWLSTLLIDPIEANGITRETLRLAFEAENIESRPFGNRCICNLFLRSIRIMETKLRKHYSTTDSVCLRGLI